jgi:hypothetical protein
MMSKGKELQYSVNRSFEKIKLLLSRDIQISGTTDILWSVAQLTTACYKTKDHCHDNTLSDVSDRELIKVNISITYYSTIEQKLG